MSDRPLTVAQAAEQLGTGERFVRRLVAEVLAGPFPGDEDTSAGVAEVFGPVRFAPAGSGP